MKHCKAFITKFIKNKNVLFIWAVPIKNHKVTVSKMNFGKLWIPHVGNATLALSIYQKIGY